MNSYIVVQSNDRVVKVVVDDDGTVHKNTLRSAFLLAVDEPIGLFRGGMALKCPQDLFVLGDNWMGQEFELQWEKARRSRPATAMSAEFEKERIQQVINEWEKRVFMVSGYDLQGSGVLISHQQILTAAHFHFKIDKSYTVRGTDNRCFSAKCEYISKKYDFAMLKSTDLPEFRTPIDQLGRGNKYVTMGYPNGINSSKPSVAKGVVEGMMDDQIHIAGVPGSRCGYSGAPIINYSGCLTGILLGGSPDKHMDLTILECLQSSAEQKYTRILGISLIHAIHSQVCSDEES